MFSLEIYGFSEVATGRVLWKKLFLKISQYSQESCRPATFKKQAPTQVFSSEYCRNFKNTYFEEHLLTAAFHFLKQVQNSREQLLLCWLFY